MTGREDERGGGSFLFWLLIAAAALYLATRAIQGVAWVLDRL